MPRRRKRCIHAPRPSPGPNRRRPGTAGSGLRPVAAAHRHRHRRSRSQPGRRPAGAAPARAGRLRHPAAPAPLAGARRRIPPAGQGSVTAPADAGRQWQRCRRRYDRTRHAARRAARHGGVQPGNRAARARRQQPHGQRTHPPAGADAPRHAGARPAAAVLSRFHDLAAKRRRPRGARRRPADPGARCVSRQRPHPRRHRARIRPAAGAGPATRYGDRHRPPLSRDAGGAGAAPAAAARRRYRTRPAVRSATLETANARSLARGPRLRPVAET